METLSIDNGNTFVTVDELTNEQVDFLVNDFIPKNQETNETYRVIANIVGYNSNKRTWLKDFISCLKVSYNEQIIVG